MLESSKGLEPGYRKKILGGHRLTFVMDSGAVKTIVPPDALPGMQIKKTRNTGKTFRVANGATVPNLGEGEIIGKEKRDKDENHRPSGQNH